MKELKAILKVFECTCTFSKMSSTTAYHLRICSAPPTLFHPKSNRTVLLKKSDVHSVKNIIAVLMVKLENVSGITVYCVRIFLTSYTRGPIHQRLTHGYKGRDTRDEVCVSISHPFSNHYTQHTRGFNC